MRECGEDKAPSTLLVMQDHQSCLKERAMLLSASVCGQMQVAVKTTAKQTASGWWMEDGLWSHTKVARVAITTMVGLILLEYPTQTDPQQTMFLLLTTIMPGYMILLPNDW